MDNTTAIGLIQTALNTLEPQVAALHAALDVLQNGFKSDIAAAEAQVQPEVDQLTQEKTILQSQVDTLTAPVQADPAPIDPAPTVTPAV